MRLAAEDFEPLLRRSRLCSLAAGEPAFEQGSTPTGVYLLRNGRCQVEHTTKEGKVEVVGVLTGGDHFGEGALLDGRDRRHHTRGSKARARPILQVTPTWRQRPPSTRRPRARRR